MGGSDYRWVYPLTSAGDSLPIPSLPFFNP